MCLFWLIAGYSFSEGSMVKTSTRTFISWIWLVLGILRRYAPLMLLYVNLADTYGTSGHKLPH